MLSAGRCKAVWPTIFSTLVTGRTYFRLRNAASGPEVADLGESERPPPTATPTGKGGGRSPFPMGLTVGGDRLYFNNRRFPARNLYFTFTSKSFYI